MRPRFCATILCVTFALALTSCGGGGGYTPATPSSPTPATSPGTGGATINIPVGDGYGGNAGFTPGNLTIAPGGSVTWQNNDTVTHVSSATTGNLWTATIEPGSSFSRTFADRGTFNYRCTIHAGMSGTITVQ